MFFLVAGSEGYELRVRSRHLAHDLTQNYAAGYESREP